MKLKIIEQITDRLLTKLLDGFSLSKVRKLWKGMKHKVKHIYKKAARSSNINISNFQMEKVLDTSRFAGREKTLNELEDAILKDHASLIVLYSLGGMGKTTVASYLAEKLKDQFEHVIWQPLQDAPDAEKVFTEFIQFFSHDMGQQSLTSIDEQINVLLKYLADRRCFLIFDNAETVLSEEYPEEGKKIYERLLREVMNRRSRSCVLVTSREKPGFVAEREKPHGYVQCMELPGLELSAIKEYIRAWELEGSEEDWKRFVEYYSGNPLLINMAANIISNEYRREIGRFLEEKPGEGIEDIISQSVGIFSSSEEMILEWLSLKSPRNRHELKAILADMENKGIEEAIQGLQKKAVVQQTEEGFSIHNMIAEYLLEKMAVQAIAAIEEGDWRKIRDFAMMEADNPDYAKENQIRKVLRPIAEQLYCNYHSRDNIIALLEGILLKIKEYPFKEQRYAPGNIIHLILCCCSKKEDILLGKISGNDILSGKDLSGYVLRQTDLENQILHKTNFTRSHFDRTRFRENIDLPSACAFSHSGSLFAAGDVKGNLVFWDGRTFEKQKIIHLHSRTIYSIAFMDDDSHIITASYDGAVKCIEINTFHEIFFYDASDLSENWNCLDVKGDLIAAAGKGKKIYLWNKKGEKPKVFSNPLWGTFHTLKIAPDGTCLVAGDSEGNLCRISLTEDTEPETVKVHDGQITAAAYHRSDSIFASGGQDGRIFLWKNDMTFWPLSSGEMHDGFVTGLVFGDDDILISAGHDKKIKVWKKQKWQNEFMAVSTLYGHKGSINSIALSEDSETLVSCSDDICIHVWNLKKGRCLKKIAGYCGWVSSLEFYGNGRYIAGGCADGTVKVWKYPSGRLGKIFYGLNDRVNPVAVDESESSIAAGAQNGEIIIWDIKNGNIVKKLDGHKKAIRVLIFLKGKGRLISGSYDGTLRYWEIKDENIKYKTISTEFPHWLGAAAVDQGERWLAYALYDGRIQIQTLNEGEKICCLETEENEIQTLSFSDDGEYLAAGGSGGSVCLWETTGWTLYKTVKIGSDSTLANVSWLAFSADGKFLLGGGKSYLKLWEVPDLKEIAWNNTSMQNLHCVRFAENGRQAVTSGDEGIIDIWDIPGLKHEKSIRNPRPYEGMNLQKTTGLPEAQLKTLRALGAITDAGEK